MVDSGADAREVCGELFNEVLSRLLPFEVLTIDSALSDHDLLRPLAHDIRMDGKRLSDAATDERAFGIAQRAWTRLGWLGVGHFKRRSMEKFDRFSILLLLAYGFSALDGPDFWSVN
jgi:hypothetical protein